MTEVLSEDEINQLLSAITGEDAAPSLPSFYHDLRGWVQNLLQLLSGSPMTVEIVKRKGSLPQENFPSEGSEALLASFEGSEMFFMLEVKGDALVIVNNLLSGIKADSFQATALRDMVAALGRRTLGRPLGNDIPPLRIRTASELEYRQHSWADGVLYILDAGQGCKYECTLYCDQDTESLFILADSLGSPAVADPRKIHLVDFKRPDRFTKEHIYTLMNIHENFARLSFTSLSVLLRSLVNLSLSSVDQLTLEEVSRSLPLPTTLAVIGMKPLKGLIAMEIDPAVTFAIIDRLCGGVGATFPIRRDLTDIERHIITGVIKGLLENLRLSWAGVFSLSPGLASVESNLSQTKIAPSYEMVALVSLDVTIGEVKGLINICLPYPTLEPIMTKLSPQHGPVISDGKLEGVVEAAERFLFQRYLRFDCASLNLDPLSLSAWQEGSKLFMDEPRGRFEYEVRTEWSN